MSFSNITINDLSHSIHQRLFPNFIEKAAIEHMGVNPITEAVAYVWGTHSRLQRAQALDSAGFSLFSGSIVTTFTLLGISFLHIGYRQEVEYFLGGAIGAFILGYMSLCSRAKRERNREKTLGSAAESLIDRLNHFFEWTDEVANWGGNPLLALSGKSQVTAIGYSEVATLMPIARSICEVRERENRRIKEEDPIDESHKEIAFQQAQQTLLEDLRERYNTLRPIGLAPEGGWGQYLRKAQDEQKKPVQKAT